MEEQVLHITEEEMKAKILCLIEDIYEHTFLGKLIVKQLTSLSGSHVGWQVKLSINCDEKPLDIAFDGNDDEFLERLEKTLRRDHLYDTDVFIGYKVPL